MLVTSCALAFTMGMLPLAAAEEQQAGRDETRGFAGIVRVSEEARVAFRVSGSVLEVEVEDGQAVEEGDVLARLDPRDFEKRVREQQVYLHVARAKVTALKVDPGQPQPAILERRLDLAKAQLKVARLKVERAEQLVAEGRVNESELAIVKAEADVAAAQVELIESELKASRQHREAHLQAASAELELAEARLVEAREDREASVIRAPRSGVVTKRRVYGGESVRAGQPLCTLADLSRLEIQAYLPMSMLAAMRSPDQVKAAARLESLPDKRFPLKVTSAGRTGADRNIGKFLVRLALPPDDSGLVVPGMAAWVTFDNVSEEED